MMRKRITPFNLALFLFCAAKSTATTATASEELAWQQAASLPQTVVGRHHPITFANETHGFYLTGSSSVAQITADVYIYNEEEDMWTAADADFPGGARSFGYGVVIPEAGNTKAYMGFGMGGDNNERLSDLWELDMSTMQYTQLASCPGSGRRHPAMVPVKKGSGIGSADIDGQWDIHVGLGDGVGGNYNDWWVYSISSNSWSEMPELFPGNKRHHPFYFGLGQHSKAYVGLGHSDGFDPYIERDWYHIDALTQTWVREPDFSSFDVDTGALVTTEGRVAGTQFSIEFIPNEESDNDNNDTTHSTSRSGSLGFVLSGDGDDHGPMATGEFHAFNSTTGKWQTLPPHPGVSRWAPGSFVMRGTARAYFTSGYNRQNNVMYDDLWKIDLSPLFPLLNITFSNNTIISATNSTSSAVHHNGGLANNASIIEDGLKEEEEESALGDGDSDIDVTMAEEVVTPSAAFGADSGASRLANNEHHHFLVYTMIIVLAYWQC
jgi:N-acetylneuraminic acid mutarotase